MNCTEVNKKRLALRSALTLALLPAIGLSVFLSYSTPASAEWKVDFSRRAKATRDEDLQAAGFPSRSPASVRAAEVGGSERVEDLQEESNKGVLESIFDVGTAVTDVVILNTEKGFVPSTIRVRKNGKYKVHIVNVNEKEKNVSFILDGFSEHHATYYGRIKTFFLEPKKEGVFSFLAPETAAEGKIVVFNPEITIRTPASADASGAAK